MDSLQPSNFCSSDPTWLKSWKETSGRFCYLFSSAFANHCSDIFVTKISCQDRFSQVHCKGGLALAMESKASEGAVFHRFPSLGPALMISMGYIDLGKWVAVVEGGGRFGFDLVLLVLLFNCTAILCQYLSACIGMATEKNLAEICSEEYCRLACILLGIQAELSMIISDLTTILGIAYALNLLFGADLFTCIFFATIGMVLLPFFLTLLDNCKEEALYISIAGFALLFYVLGVLISQPEVPLIMNGSFPKLSGESAYSLMALLGANIMAHNFYIHSSIVQQQRRLPNVALGALFHDHFFAILFIFTGIFLVNYVLMNSAAAIFGSTDVVLNSEDFSLLMDQIFRSPIAHIAFFWVLFFSSQITALTQNIGGQVILRYFFGIDLSFWVHRVLVKVLTIIPALYCANSAGVEGIYQLLLFCQVILAMLLPSSVIPLFRVASSRFIMGAFKISWYIEILALFAFLGMLAPNVIFIIEMLFGNSIWIINLTGSTESIKMVPYTVLLLIACTSIGLTFHLAVTPLKSASDRPDTQIWARNLPKEQQGLSEGREDNDLDMMKYDEDQESAVESALAKSMESQSDRSMLEFDLDLSEKAIDSDHNSHQSAPGPNLNVNCAPPTYHPEESKSVVEVDSMEIADKASSGVLLDEDIYQRIESKNSVEKDVGAEADVHMDKDNEEGDALEPVVSFKGTSLSSTSEGPGSFESVKGKSSDVGDGGGSLSKLSGLGRAARRQLAAILDEFWGNLFDFHGKLTKEASANRLDVLLGLDLRTVGSSLKTDATGAESSKSFFPDADKGPIFPRNSRDYNSPKQKKNHNAELPFGVQMGYSSWSQNMQELNAHVQRSCSNVLEPSERPYSSLHLPQYSDNRDYQPATIHGYQIASYLRGVGAAKTPYSSSISPNLPLTPNSPASFVPTLRDQVMYTHRQNELGSLGTSSLQNSAMSRISRSQVERPYYESSFAGMTENVASSTCTKKYHSSPDISALIALSRNSYLNDGKRGSTIDPRPSSGRVASDQSQYLNPFSRAGNPLAFDHLSPPKLQRDVFSLQPSLNPEIKSLWSRQPFEQLFGMTGKDQHGGDGGVAERPNITPRETFPYAESGAKLLQSLRFCIMKLLKLEGSDWLFKQNGGFDEELIDQVAETEKYLHISDASEMNPAYTGELQHLSSDRKFTSFQKSEEADLPYFMSLPNCGDGCIWRAALVVSFGVWCIRRVLELSLVESRPELWGKYTYVLNRLQGIIDPAFLKPREFLAPCSCLDISTKDMKGLNPSIENPSNESFTTASMVLEIIKDVESAVSSRKGRTGTAAGDVAFPKGKENLASVLKRYKRRLLNKFPVTQEASSSPRKIPSSATSLVL